MRGVFFDQNGESVWSGARIAALGPISRIDKAFGVGRGLLHSGRSVESAGPGSDGFVRSDWDGYVVSVRTEDVCVYSGQVGGSVRTRRGCIRSDHWDGLD